MKKIPIKGKIFNKKDIIKRTAVMVDRTLDDMAKFVLNQADKNLRSGDFSPAIGKGAFDRGHLASTGRTEKAGLFKRRVIYDAEYAAAIEYGTPPHPVPFDPIFKWVKRKIRIRTQSRSRKLKDQEAKNLARKIVFSISQYGTLPRPFLRTAMAKLDRKEIDRLQKKHKKKLFG